MTQTARTPALDLALFGDHYDASKLTRQMLIGEHSALLALAKSQAAQIKSMSKSLHLVTADRDAKGAQIKTLREALAGITVIAEVPDGAVLIGPQGWKLAQAALALSKEGK